MLKLTVCCLDTLAAVEQFGSGFGEQRNAVGVRVTNHRAEKRCQNLFTRLRYACNALCDPRVPGQELMAAFVGDHRSERKILGVGVALERFSVDVEQVLFGGVATAVLRPTRLAVYVPILDTANKPQLPMRAARLCRNAPAAQQSGNPAMDLPCQDCTRKNLRSASPLDFSRSVPISNAVTPSPILPGSTVGVLGSGQLGRMFAIAARRMGYRVHTYSPDNDTPTGQVADRGEIVGGV